MSFVEPKPAGEPTFSVSRYGTLLVDWEQQGQVQTPVGPTGYAISNDSGATFAANHVPKVPGSQFQYDVTSGGGSPNGTMYVGFGSYPGTTCGSGFTSDDYVSAVWDNGSHASTPMMDIPCSAAGAGQFLDRDWLTSTPNGTVFHVVDDGSGYVWLDTMWGGTHFGAPKVIYNQGANGIPMNAFAYNDTLWGVGDAGDSSGAGGCFVTISRDAGNTWTPGTDPSGCVGGGSGISWEVTWGAGASLLLDYATGSGIEFVRSTDLGQTWSSPVLISGTVPGGTSFQTPTIGGDPATGEVEAVWLDTRTNTGSYHWNVYETDSPDNGVTWNPVRTVSSAVAGYGANFWPGDYVWSQITPWGTAGAVWGDNRTQTFLATYFAQVPLQNPADGQLNVHVVDSTGGPVANAQVTVGTNVSRTGAGGSVSYYALSPGTYLVHAYDPTLGSGSTRATVSAGGNATVTVTLGGLPLSATAAANPTTGSVPLSVAFTGSANGGTSPYTYAWTFADGSAPGTGATTSHTYTVPGTYVATLWVNDSAAGAATAPVTVTVNAAPYVVAVTATPTGGAAPLTTHFYLNASGGIGPYALSTYFGDGTYRTGSSRGAAEMNHTYTAPGTYHAWGWVNDSAAPAPHVDRWNAWINASGSSGALGVTASASPSSGPVPLFVNLTATPTGGTPPYTGFAWSFGDGTTGSSTWPTVTVMHRYATQGHFNATVTVTDTAGGTATSTTVEVDVLPHAGLPPLTVTLAAAPASGVAVGATVTLTASPAGGSATYASFLWSFGDGSATATTTTASTTHAFQAVGTYTVTVQVTDSVGDQASAQTTVGVVAASPAPSSNSALLTPVQLDLLVAAVVIAVAAITVLLVLRRRRRRASPPPPGSWTPPPGAYGGAAPGPEGTWAPAEPPP